MSVVGRLYGQMLRSLEKAERLKAKPPVRGVRAVRRQQKISRLEARAQLNREILDDWDKERWG